MTGLGVSLQKLVILFYNVHADKKVFQEKG